MNKIEQFKAITNELSKIYELKNLNYGDSFGDTFKEFGMAMPCIRLNDKLSRIKSLVRQGESANCDDERIEDSLIDLANYSIMTIIELRNTKQASYNAIQLQNKINDK